MKYKIQKITWTRFQITQIVKKSNNILKGSIKINPNMQIKCPELSNINVDNLQTIPWCRSFIE